MSLIPTDAETKIIAVYAARLFFENILLRLMVSSLYWGSVELGYVFIYSLVQNIFSLVVASLHYSWCNPQQGFQFISPALLCNHPKSQRFRSVLSKVIPASYHEIFFATLLMGYCIMLSSLATSGLLATIALSTLALSMRLVPALIVPKLTTKDKKNATHLLQASRPSSAGVVSGNTFTIENSNDQLLCIF